MPYLIVVAHPDDEVLGSGATVRTLVADGEVVNVCILCERAESRMYKCDAVELENDIKLAQEVLGVNRVYTGGFHDSNLNICPHIEIVRFIEKCIIETGADNIITHHPLDMNLDHQITSKYCQEAARLSHRRTIDVPPLRQLLFMEVLSSTDWSFGGNGQSFNPNLFVSVGEANIGKKIEALSKYRGVMREFPHPRCEEIIKSLAAYRGGQSGTKYAEAFQIAFRNSV